ncbi:MAG: hypothetical protein FLDDKLPJ_00199 [Phycisphaerae bacterium]|nr:hypothetical protein [Phycisphaerae bacterium]
MARTRQQQRGGTPSRLSVIMKGPKVGAARLSAADLADIVKRTQKALKRVGRVLYGQQSARQGRDRADIEQLCELFLVAWKSGSAVADLELGEPPAQMHMFGYIGEESLKAFTAGMEKLKDAAITPASLPAGFDRGVLQTCNDLGRALEHGIDSITFQSQNGVAAQSFALDGPLRARVQELLGLPADVSIITKTGRLEELNGHGALTGRFWEPNGTRWLCHFKQEHLEQLPDAWMRTVRLMGRATVEESKERILEVESVDVLDVEVAATAPQEVPFWESMTLDELAERQGVSAVDDLDELSALWPVDDDPEELLHHVLHERAARKAIDDGGNAP